MFPHQNILENKPYSSSLFQNTKFNEISIDFMKIIILYVKEVKDMISCRQ